MNHRARRPNVVTQDSDDSDDDFNHRDYSRYWHSQNMRRRNNLTNDNTVPVVNDLSLSPTSTNSNNNPPQNNDPSFSTASHSTSSNTNSSEGWLSTRKIRSSADRVRFREEAKEVIKKIDLTKLRSHYPNSKLVQ